MKKLIALMLALMMVLALAACGGTAPAAQDPPGPEPSEPVQEPAEPAAQEPVIPPEEAEEPPEGSAGPEIKAPDMVEITMDNWEDYLEIISSSGEVNGYPAIVWGLAVKEEYSEQYKQHGDYCLPEDTQGQPLVFILGNADCYAHDSGNVVAELRITVSDESVARDLFGTSPAFSKDYTFRIQEVNYVSFLMDDSQAQVSSFLADGQERMCAAHWMEKQDISEQDIALLEETVTVEITAISGTIPVWN